ncbi:hypothetical protein PG985_014315 [Apiospora marii]|uniref:uncharacterized protein n=1 Tax=Apiospora marii TaxID=335849 RepID=UPI0031319533
MASDDFPQFLRLPKEIQHMVWKIAVVEENKNRIICLLADTQCVVPTKSRLLAPSPVFSATKESRAIAKMVYSTRLAIVSTFHNTPVVKQDHNECTAVGAIRISLEHDIFLIGLGFSDFDKMPDFRGISKMFTSSKLESTDIKKIKNVIEAKSPNRSAQESPTAPNFDKKKYSGVNTYYQTQGDYRMSWYFIAKDFLRGDFDTLDEGFEKGFGHWSDLDRIVGPLSLTSSQDPKDVQEEP